MRQVIELANKGVGCVSPNPMVGAVIVKNNRVIGKGYHEKYGCNHAEINAINDAINEDLIDSTLYVNLEPCSHFGKTPPCVDKIISSKIKRVVIGMLDPNPIVSGRGVQKLIDANIEVEIGILEEECKKLNEIYIKYITTNKPFVLMKFAMSLDGKIATSSGESKYISSKKSLESVHLLRNQFQAIMVGVDTVIFDDPQLTSRIDGCRNPIRIIVDSNLRIPLDSKIVETAKDIKTIVATTFNANKNKIEKLKSLGIIVLVIKDKNKRVDLNELIDVLGQLKIDSILIEGGATLNYSALESKIVDKVLVYIAPKIIGGKSALSPIGGRGISKLKDAFKVDTMKIISSEEDVLIEGYFKGGV